MKTWGLETGSGYRYGRHSSQDIFNRMSLEGWTTFSLASNFYLLSLLHFILKHLGVPRATRSRGITWNGIA